MILLYTFTTNILSSQLAAPASCRLATHVHLYKELEKNTEKWQGPALGVRFTGEKFIL